MKNKSFGLTETKLSETKLFDFHGIFKKKGGGPNNETPSGSATAIKVFVSA